MDGAFIVIGAQFSLLLSALALAGWYMVIGLGIVGLAALRVIATAAKLLTYKFRELAHPPVWHIQRHLQPKT